MGNYGPWLDQLSSYDAAEAVEPELGLCVAAGTVALIDHNMWHRQTWNSGTDRRIMVKFHYERVEEPAPAAVPGALPDWGAAVIDLPACLRNEPMWRSTWRWMHCAPEDTREGEGRTEPAETARLLDVVASAGRDATTEGVRAAFALAEAGRHSAAMVWIGWYPIVTSEKRLLKSEYDRKLGVAWLSSTAK
jgi:hypothetical protein